MYEINNNPRKIYKSFGTNILRNNVAPEKKIKASEFPTEEVTSWSFQRYFFKPPDDVNNKTLPMMDTTLRDPQPQPWGKAIVSTEHTKVRIAN